MANHLVTFKEFFNPLPLSILSKKRRGKTIKVKPRSVYNVSILFSFPIKVYIHRVRH